MGLVLLAGLAIGPAVFAEDEGAGVSSGGAGSGTVLGDVMRMLEQGVGSPVIEDWLSKQTRNVPALSPDDVIGLTRAGASERLVEQLIEMSAHQGEPSPQPTAEPSGVRPPEPSPDGSAGVAFSFVYRSQSDDGEENSRRWAMFVYLDGEPLTWSKSSGSFSLNSVNTSKQISPGPHVIRLVRESHTRRSKAAPWEHEAQASRTPIVFNVESGDGWHMSISWRQPAVSFKEQQPLSWRLTRWDVDVAGVEKTGTRKEDFKQICEDAEASVPEGKKPNSDVKSRLKSCASWSSLWGGVDEFPAREELLETLARDDFRPSRD
jgi:hypothetical protein